jgi:hypothetical protein
MPFGGDRMKLAGLLLALAVSVTTIVSCGSGGGGSSNGGLCEQCGDDPDGPCQASVEVQPGPNAPACDNGGAPPCTVTLHCFRKRSSAQRRCFPEQDLTFRCDGEPADRSTPGPTASPTPTPKAVQQTVRFSVSASVIVSSIGLTVTYPTTVGNFTGSGTNVDCTSSGVGQTLARNDDDNGTLTLVLTTTSGLSLTLPVDITCTFDDATGQTLADGQLGVTITPGGTNVAVTVS